MAGLWQGRFFTWAHEASLTWFRLLVFAITSQWLVLLFAVITNSLNYFGTSQFPKQERTEKENFTLQVDRIIRLRAEGVEKERVHAEEDILTALMKKLAVAEGKDPDGQDGSSKGEEKGKK